MSNTVISSVFNDHNHILRRIHSFVRRHGRLTKGQQNAIDNYWSLIGTEYQAAPLNLNNLFGRKAPVILEIGFGMGTSLVTMAVENPQQDFLGIEVYLPGIGTCLSNAQNADISNLRIIYHDAVEVLENMIQNHSINMVQLFFPDPWHKAKHNKRRIVQPAFVELVRDKLYTGGVFHIATDWQPYAKHILDIMTAMPHYRNLSDHGDYILRPRTRPLTKFEQRGLYLGHDVWDLMFEKIA